MKDRLSRWGVGPRIAAAALTYAAVAGAAAHRWPGVCSIQFVPYVVLVSLAAVFLATGVSMLVLAARSAMRAYNRDQLATSGLFALARHPIYSAWIVLIVPGLTLLFRSWPLLLTPMIAYSVFKLAIHREDEYLQQGFGDAYLDYGALVNELNPIPGFWR